MNLALPALSWPTPSNYAPVAIRAAVLTMLAGLPLAVQLTDGSEPIWPLSVQARSSDAIVIATPVRVSERLALTLDRGLVSMADRNSNTRAGDGQGVVAIDEAELTLDLAAVDQATPAAGPETPSVGIPSIAGFSAGALRLRRSTFTVVGPSRERMAIRDVNATVMASRKGSHKLTGTGHFNGQRVSFEAMWSDAAARAGTPQLPLRLSIKSAFIEATIDGLVSSGAKPVFDGSAEFRMPSLRRFVTWAGLGSGVGEHLRAITVSGPLNWSTARMAFPRAVIGIDGNQATGALTINHGAKRISIDGTLAFAELDLGRYWLSRPQPEAVAAKRGSNTTPFLAMFDADLRVSAGKIRTPAVELGRAAATIALTDGRLQADLAGLELENGTAGGQLKLDVNHPVPKAGVKLKIVGVDAGRLLAVTLKPNSLLGRTNVIFDGTAEGRSLSEVVKTLAGRGSFDLVEPGRLGLDLPALAYAARGASTVGWAAAGKGSTAIEALNGRFRVINGAISLESIQARTGSAAIVAGGRLDVPSRLMDMTVALGPGSIGEAPVTAQDVLVLRGTWDNPAISLHRQAKPALKAEVPVRSF